MRVNKIEHTPVDARIIAPVQVIRCWVTCGACPKTWNGITSDRKKVFVRYRWGNLRIEVDNQTVFFCKVDEETDEERQERHDGLRASFSEEVVIQSDKDMLALFEAAGDPGHSYDGNLDYNELVEITKSYFQWPETDDPKSGVLVI